jgi:hypothetical protein
MSLRSKMFKGDPRLEACRLKDSAHITAGAGRPQCVDQIGGNSGESVIPSVRPQAFAANPVRRITGKELPPKALSIKWQRTSAVNAGQNENLF